MTEPGSVNKGEGMENTSCENWEGNLSDAGSVSDGGDVEIEDVHDDGVAPLLARNQQPNTETDVVSSEHELAGDLEVDEEPSRDDLVDGRLLCDYDDFDDEDSDSDEDLVYDEDADELDEHTGELNDATALGLTGVFWRDRRDPVPMPRSFLAENYPHRAERQRQKFTIADRAGCNAEGDAWESDLLTSEAVERIAAEDRRVERYMLDKVMGARVDDLIARGLATRAARTLQMSAKNVANYADNALQMLEPDDGNSPVDSSGDICPDKQALDRAAANYLIDSSEGTRVERDSSGDVVPRVPALEPDVQFLAAARDTVAAWDEKPTVTVQECSGDDSDDDDGEEDQQPRTHVSALTTHAIIPAIDEQYHVKKSIPKKPASPLSQVESADDQPSSGDTTVRRRRRNSFIEKIKAFFKGYSGPSPPPTSQHVDSVLDDEQCPKGRKALISDASKRERSPSDDASRPYGRRRISYAGQAMSKDASEVHEPSNAKPSGSALKRDVVDHPEDFRTNPSPGIAWSSPLEIGPGPQRSVSLETDYQRPGPLWSDTPFALDNLGRLYTGPIRRHTAATATTYTRQQQDGRRRNAARLYKQRPQGRTQSLPLIFERARSFRAARPRALVSLKSGADLTRPYTGKPDQLRVVVPRRDVRSPGRLPSSVHGPDLEHDTFCYTEKRQTLSSALQRSTSITEESPKGSLHSLPTIARTVAELFGSDLSCGADTALHSPPDSDSDNSRKVRLRTYNGEELLISGIKLGKKPETGKIVNTPNYGNENARPTRNSREPTVSNFDGTGDTTNPVDEQWRLDTDRALRLSGDHHIPRLYTSEAESSSDAVRNSPQQAWGPITTAADRLPSSVPVMYGNRSWSHHGTPPPYDDDEHMVSIGEISSIDMSLLSSMNISQDGSVRTWLLRLCNAVILCS